MVNVPYRSLLENQSCQVWVYDATKGQSELVLETRDILLEAPNWAPDTDGLILNGDGLMWRLPLVGVGLSQISFDGLPPVNNDHVPSPDGRDIYMSTYNDWHIYKGALSGGPVTRITGKTGPAGMLHFLHGVSPDGGRLAFVGVFPDPAFERLKFKTAEICTVSTDGSDFTQITNTGTPSDGPEYSPDGAWIYFNTEVFSGHAQIARMRPDGSGVERLNISSTVDWFPHFAPNAKKSVYLAYPEGTVGHPANKWVDLMLVDGEDWQNATSVARLFGGQGTINVNSWAPDSNRFAYVAYPMDQ